MRKKVYDYFRENPNTTHHQCAQALHIPEKVVLDAIAELYKDRLLDLHALPLGNELDPSSSSFYFACREYHD